MRHGLHGRPLRGRGLHDKKPGIARVATESGGDTTVAGTTDVILKAGSTSGGILKAGGVSGYIKKAG